MADKPLRIIMIGPSNAGKTTFLASSYLTYQKPVSGFTFAANVMDHASLSAVGRAVKSGRYPPPSAVRAAYELTLHYEKQAVMPFQWTDYRGGALMDHSSSAQTEELLQDIRSAHGIIAFADASRIAAGAKGRRDADRLASLLVSALGQHPKRQFGLAIALTKFDLLPCDADVSAIGEPFHELTSAIAESDNIHGALLPVACGRRGRNLSLPIAWTLGVAISHRAKKAADKAAEFVAEASRHRANDWFGNRLMAFLKDEPSAYDRSVTATRAAVRHQQEMSRLAAPASQLVALLDDQIRF